MNAQEFVNALKEVVVDASIKGIESTLIKPSGRQPVKKLVIMSSWFNELQEKDKQIVLKIVRESIETCLFSLLCVLDGVAAIENTEEKGMLELYYKKDGLQELLNNTNEEYLHNLL